MNSAYSFSLRPILCVLPLAFAVAGCGTPTYEVVTYPDGATRTPNTADAVSYCKEKGMTARILERAPGQTGVMFRCI